MQINFFQEDANFPSGLRRTQFRSIVQVIVQNETRKKIDYINFIACSDNYLLEINQGVLRDIAERSIRKGRGNRRCLGPLCFVGAWQI